MNKLISKVTLEIDGREHIAETVKPADEAYRERVALMGGTGYIDLEPEYGLEITFVESKIAAFTPDIRRMTNGTVAIVYDDGSRDVYSNCATMSRSRSGFTVNNKATISYIVVSDSEPMES